MNRGDIKLVIDRCIAHDLPDAADLIETLRQQLATMTAERDAYMRDYGAEQDRKREVAQQLSEAQAELNEFRKNAKVGFDRQLRDQQQLSDHIRREVMLRDALNEMLDRFGIMSDGCIKQACNALAATADLKNVRLCKKKPTAWCQDVIYEMAPEFAFSWVETQLHDFPLFSAWEPKQ